MALSANELADLNRSEIPAQTVTNTSIGYVLSKCINTNQPFVVPRWTTLNENYKILAEESLGQKASRDFELKYFGVGVRGSNCVGQDSRGVSQMQVNQHQPIDANLFTPVPFIARPLTEDLDSFNRAKYRMRTVEERNGELYAFYWLKLIDFAKYNPHEVEIEHDPITGEEKTNPYIHTEDNLKNPQPVPLTSEGTVPISNLYVNGSAILDCTLYQADLREMSLACKIYYNDASYASVNELGVAYGIDVEHRGAIAGNGTIQYTEVASAIFAHYITERDGRNALTNTQLNNALDHGASAPMLLHTVANSSAQGQGN